VRVPHERHVLVTGPTRVGKTTKVTVKMLLTDDEEDMIILDLKHGELERLTRPYRAQVSSVYRFDPAGASSDRWNIWDLMPWGTSQEINAVQRAAAQLSIGEQESVSQRPLSEDGQYYRRWARVILWGSALYLHAKQDPQWPCSMPGLLRFFTQGGTSVRVRLQALAGSPDPVVREVAALLMSRRPKDQEEVFSSAAGWLMPWFDQTLATHMGETTIPFQALQQGTPMTIYLRATPADVSPGGCLRGVFRLLIEQLLSLAATRSVRAYQRRVRLVLADFNELGYFQPLESISAFYGESGWGLWLEAQSPAQIVRNYGEHTALFENCDTWVCFQPNDPTSAELLVKKLGKRTVTEHLRGKGRNPWHLWPSHHAREQFTERALLDAWEVSHMGTQHAIGFLGGVQRKGVDQPLTVRLRMRPYWQDRHLRKRVVI
jgi:type IV secretory pathway TraG/TraD family ATPase VirD4